MGGMSEHAVWTLLVGICVCADLFGSRMGDRQGFSDSKAPLPGLALRKVGCLTISSSSFMSTTLLEDMLGLLSSPPKK